mmetsp:Transcript_54396/g.100494  ORF Transcript_54396/g.100494 Transcript_54396/m.100494 type:complete len:427 (-) Transcript_54396:69-1349(-)
MGHAKEGVRLASHVRQCRHGAPTRVVARNSRQNRLFCMWTVSFRTLALAIVLVLTCVGMHADSFTYAWPMQHVRGGVAHPFQSSRGRSTLMLAFQPSSPEETLLEEPEEDSVASAGASRQRRFVKRSVIDVEEKKESVIRNRKWNAAGLQLVPPEEVRNRAPNSRGKMGKHYLGYLGDAVWEFLVLGQQYRQVVRSPMTISQAVRNHKQAQAARLLFRGNVLTDEEKKTLKWGITNAFRKKAETNAEGMAQVGHEVFSAASGLRTLLGYMWIDADSSESRLEAVAKQLGLLHQPGHEDALLSQLTNGIYQPSPNQGLYFMALAPLGNVALRLYVSHYLSNRPLRSEEFIYRVQMALREEEIDIAAVGFLRDDATADEIKLMKAARERKDTYGFAFQCLLGHHALNTPYRLHQILSNFGWAVPLEGT